MSDIVTSRIFTDGERGITAAKMNDITVSSVIQPAFYTSKPTASTADPADIALILKSGAYAQVPVSALAGSATQAQIWSTRLRSFNAIGNPNFEVDQRLCNAGALAGAGSINVFGCDRWMLQKATATGTASVAAVTNSLFPLPGTNFAITNSYLNVTTGTLQAALAAGEYILLSQSVEGSVLRELIYDVHSISILVSCNIASFKFSVCLRAGSYSLVLPCTTSATVNQWTIITLPNLPVWPGVLNVIPGTIGYQLMICLGAGSTYQAPSTGAWVSGNYLGYVGQSNFLATANANFYCRFVQHEPGPVCSTLMDKPFSQNLDECLRYYQKSYNYGSAAGTASQSLTGIVTVPNTYVIGFPGFSKPMAKIPSVVIYDGNNGAANSMYNNSLSAHPAVTGVSVGEKGILYAQLGTAQTSGHWMAGAYTSDTGW